MKNLYERVSALLGKPIDDTLCSRFVHDIGYEPKFNGTYMFAKSGLILMHHKRIIVAAFFQLENDDTQDWLELYSGDLPNDIRPGDARSIISTKLGVKPINALPDAYDVQLDVPLDHSSMTMETYAMPPLLLTFNFTQKNGGVDNVLTSLIVRLDDDNIPEVCKQSDEERPEESSLAIVRRRKSHFNFRNRHRGN